MTKRKKHLTVLRNFTEGAPTRSVKVYDYWLSGPKRAKRSLNSSSSGKPTQGR